MEPLRIVEPWQEKLKALEKFNQETVETLGLESSKTFPAAKARVTFLKLDSPVSQEDVR